MILGNKKDLNEYKKVSIDNVKKVNFKEFKISFNSFSFQFAKLFKIENVHEISSKEKDDHLNNLISNFLETLKFKRNEIMSFNDFYSSLAS